MKRSEVLALGIVAVAAVGLRLAFLQAAPLDFDEVYEATHADAGFAEVYSRADDFPPLYGWLVGVWLAVWGDDAAGRWFSAVVGIAAVGASGRLGAAVGGRGVGLWAALLTAASANHVLYSQQFRAYTLYLLLATLTMLAAWRVKRRRTRADWAWFGLAAWLAMGTHYFSALLIAPLGLMLLLDPAATAADRRRGLIAAGLFLAACLVWVPALVADLEQPAATYTAPDLDPEAWAYTYLTLVTGFTLGPPMHELRELTPIAGVAVMAPWALLAAAPSIVLARGGVRRLSRTESAWLAWLLIGTPLVVAAVAQATAIGYVYRHFAWIVVPLLIVLAAGASQWKESRLMRVAASLFLVVNLWAIANRHLDPRYRVDDFLAAKRLLMEQPDTGPVLAAPRYFGQAVRYHFGDEIDAVTPAASRMEQRGWEETLTEYRDRLGDGPTCWLVLQHYPEGDPNTEPLRELVDTLGAEHMRRVSATIDIYRASATAVVKAVDESRAAAVE